jgi:polysaccharide pyruvyl transferase WcaK-like protein
MGYIGKIAHRIKDPKGVLYNNYEKLQNGFILKSNSILEAPKQVGPQVVNIANFNTYNGGDALLSVVLRDLIDDVSEDRMDWKKIHAHKSVTKRTINKLNQTDGVVIGGGGLFLVDNNKNKNSGWQWGISTPYLKNIQVPISVFAVGYNRFRGQQDFPQVFIDNINTLVEKSSFFGLRNLGSVNAIKGYLDPSLRSKVHYQPCMTTVIKDLYTFIDFPKHRKDVFALNMAFDRPELRFGNDYEQKFERFCIALKQLTNDFELEYVSHALPDEKFMKYLDKYQVPYKAVKLYKCSGARLIEYYKTMPLTIGMRGHAQMIPFGVGSCILSIITHDKVRWFLEDNGLDDFGLEFLEENFDSLIVNKVKAIMSNIEGNLSIMEQKRKNLKDLSYENASVVSNSFVK